MRSSLKQCGATLAVESCQIFGDEVKHASPKCPIIKSLFPDVTEHCRRKLARGLIQRHNRPESTRSSEYEPYKEVVSADDHGGRNCDPILGHHGGTILTQTKLTLTGNHTQVGRLDQGSENWLFCELRTCAVWSGHRTEISNPLRITLCVSSARFSAGNSSRVNQRTSAASLAACSSPPMRLQRKSIST